MSLSLEERIAALEVEREVVNKKLDALLLVVLEQTSVTIGMQSMLEEMSVVVPPARTSASPNLN